MNDPVRLLTERIAQLEATLQALHEQSIARSRRQQQTVAALEERLAQATAAEEILRRASGGTIRQVTPAPRKRHRRDRHGMHVVHGLGLAVVLWLLRSRKVVAAVSALTLASGTALAPAVLIGPGTQPPAYAATKPPAHRAPSASQSPVPSSTQIADDDQAHRRRRARRVKRPRKPNPGPSPSGSPVTWPTAIPTVSLTPGPDPTPTATDPATDPGPAPTPTDPGPTATDPPPAQAPSARTPGQAVGSSPGGTMVKASGPSRRTGMPGTLSALAGGHADIFGAETWAVLAGWQHLDRVAGRH